MEVNKNTVMSYDKRVKYTQYYVTLQESGYSYAETEVETLDEKFGNFLFSLLGIMNEVVIYIAKLIAFIIPLIIILLPAYLIIRKRILRKNKLTK